MFDSACSLRFRASVTLIPSQQPDCRRPRRVQSNIEAKPNRKNHGDFAVQFNDHGQFVGVATSARGFSLSESWIHRSLRGHRRRTSETSSLKIDESKPKPSARKWRWTTEWSRSDATEDGVDLSGKGYSIGSTPSCFSEADAALASLRETCTKLEMHGPQSKEHSRNRYAGKLS